MSRLHKQENFCSQVSRLLSCSGTVIHNFKFVFVFYTKSILRFCSIKVRMLRNCNFEILELQELKCNFKKDYPRYEIGLVGGQIFMGPRLILWGVVYSLCNTLYFFVLSIQVTQCKLTFIPYGKDIHIECSKQFK